MANYDRKDSYYLKAKEDGYRSRASYKLLEINEKFKIFKKDSYVLDLGSWPGGWLQVAKKLSPKGFIAGIDLVEIEPIKGVYTTIGDASDDEKINEILKKANGLFDIVLSDMAAKLTGIKATDDVAAAGILELALFVMQKTLKQNGIFVAKVFKCGEIDTVIKEARKLFRTIKRVELKSSRKTSNEFYIICFDYKANNI
ncbi:MAG: SAM-dependent methyltransferase [Bdellovibrionota bacterium]